MRDNSLHLDPLERLVEDSRSGHTIARFATELSAVIVSFASASLAVAGNNPSKKSAKPDFAFYAGKTITWVVPGSITSRVLPHWRDPSTSSAVLPARDDQSRFEPRWRRHHGTRGR